MAARQQRIYIVASFITGVVITIGIGRIYSSIVHRFQLPREKISDKELPEHASKDDLDVSEENILEGIEGCIGNTPLFKIKSLSEATGCEILMKAEV